MVVETLTQGSCRLKQPCYRMSPAGKSRGVSSSWVPLWAAAVFWLLIYCNMDTN